MLQYLIVYSIILTAFIFAAVSLFRYIATPVSKCHGCTMKGSGCTLEEFKLDIALKQHRLTEIKKPTGS